MSIVSNGFKSAVLWHMNGCIVTFYEAENQNEKKRKPTDTICFTNKANLAHRNVNSLRIASPAVPYLEHLSSLRLQHNNLTTLPNELWRLTNLQELNLGFNELDQIPIQIGSLVNLRELYLHNNHLTEIPFQIGNLKFLTVLDITANKLRTIPSSILKLQLENFWFDLNDFSDAIPTTIKTLKFISLQNICLQTIGQLCALDPDARKVISDSSDFITDSSTLLGEQPELLISCAHCQSLLYQPGLEVIDMTDCNNKQFAVTYKVCSQSCYIHVFNQKQQEHSSLIL